jgi:hypothetical protein
MTDTTEQSTKYLPNHGYIVWVPEGHSFMTWPTVVEDDEEAASGAQEGERT